MAASAEDRFRANRLVGMSLILATLIAPFTGTFAALDGFCERLPRAAYRSFEKSQLSTDWFEVYEVEPDVWAIYEPFQWQEVISYLIVGSESALLFDTGNGLGDVRAIVDRLTDKPVQVLNSHSHFDHIGGNYQFGKVLSPSTDFSIANSRGNDSRQIQEEASPAALCKGLPDGVTAENHRINSYSIASQVFDGDIIDLGGRTLEVLLVPGHTDDSLALFDRESGLLWTGDSFYEGPIWLFAPETDLAAYEKSLARLVALIPQVTVLLPAHNTPSVAPEMLVRTQEALQIVFRGEARSVPTWDGVVSFEFKGFGFLMREDYTKIAD